MAEGYLVVRFLVSHAWRPETVNEVGDRGHAEDLARSELTRAATIGHACLVAIFSPGGEVVVDRHGFTPLDVASIVKGVERPRAETPESLPIRAKLSEEEYLQINTVAHELRDQAGEGRARAEGLAASAQVLFERLAEIDPEC
jgi:hypothetical protein